MAVLRLVPTHVPVSQPAEQLPTLPWRVVVAWCVVGAVLWGALLAAVVGAVR